MLATFPKQAKYLAIIHLLKLQNHYVTQPSYTRIRTSLVFVHFTVLRINELITFKNKNPKHFLHWLIY